MILEGIPSGDLECWCFLVDRNTFINVTGRKPKQYNVGRFAKKGSPHRYMLYPESLIDDRGGKLVVLAIESKLANPTP